MERADTKPKTFWYLSPYLWPSTTFPFHPNKLQCVPIFSNVEVENVFEMGIQKSVQRPIFHSLWIFWTAISTMCQVSNGVEIRNAFSRTHIWTPSPTLTLARNAAVHLPSWPLSNKWTLQKKTTKLKWKLPNHLFRYAWTFFLQCGTNEILR